MRLISTATTQQGEARNGDTVLITALQKHLLGPSQSLGSCVRSWNEIERNGKRGDRNAKCGGRRRTQTERKEFSKCGWTCSCGWRSCSPLDKTLTEIHLVERKSTNEAYTELEQ